MLVQFIMILTVFVYRANSRFVEGVLKTNEKWAFLARFCFLSEEGQFEYDIEFNENQGDPNLLLYYDTDDQWPSVYKSKKTCEEREAVLNIGQNQIVNLTARLYSYRDFSGCIFLHEPLTTPRTYTINVPTFATLKTSKKKGVIKFSSTVNSFTTENILSTTDKIISSASYSAFTTATYSSKFENFITTTAVNNDNGVYSTEFFYDTPTTEITDIPSSTRPLSIGPKLPKTSQEKHIKKRSIPTKNLLNAPTRNDRKVSCHNSRRFRSSRERWWFIAISNCNGTKGIDIRYKILMTNGPPGDYWHEHFSADEFYILPVLMAFSVAYSFLMLGIVVCSMELKSRQLLHTTYKIFVFSVVVQLFGILFISCCYLKLAVTGLLANKIKRLGLIMMGTSETSFLLLLLLLAKGYTITRGRLPLSASIKLTIFMCIYIVTYISIFIYEAKVFDPGEVLYLYESPAGYGLITLRVLAWCMFIYSTIFTLKHYPEKGNFYYPFNIFGTIWSIAGPAFIISANTYIDKWVRESIVCAVLLFISFGGHLMFLILTMPSVANKNFPYHVRTTQIGIMEVTGNAGTSTMDQFSHHVYEPSTTMQEQTVIIPLTRRTEEIFEDMYNRRTFKRNEIPNDQINGDDRGNIRNVAIDNVLNWSLAKNLPALELPQFDRFNNRSSTASATSRTTNNSNSLHIVSRSSSLTRVNKEIIQNNCEDYIKDVPIELFTVSKMVVTTKNALRKNTQNVELD